MSFGLKGHGSKRRAAQRTGRMERQLQPASKQLFLQSSSLLLLYFKVSSASLSLKLLPSLVAFPCPGSLASIKLELCKDDGFVFIMDRGGGGQRGERREKRRRANVAASQKHG